MAKIWFPRSPDSDLRELYDRASWVFAISSIEQFQLWLSNRLPMASNQAERDWLSLLLNRVSATLRNARRHAEAERNRAIRTRCALLGKINQMGRRDIAAKRRRDLEADRAFERELIWLTSKAYARQQRQAAEQRWEATKRKLIARDEERRIQGRWLISR